MCRWQPSEMEQYNLLVLSLRAALPGCCTITGGMARGVIGASLSWTKILKGLLSSTLTPLNQPGGQLLTRLCAAESHL